jgi:two-component system, NtrC family, response regulator AtoC
VVLSHGGPINFEHMVPGHEHRMRTTRSRAGNSLESMIQNLVRFALQSIPPEDGVVFDRLVKGVERELLEQVLPLCDNVLVKAAARLGINRNTLHKKLNELRPADPGANSQQDVGAKDAE